MEAGIMWADNHGGAKWGCKQGPWGCWARVAGSFGAVMLWTLTTGAEWGAGQRSAGGLKQE